MRVKVSEVTEEQLQELLRDGLEQHGIVGAALGVFDDGELAIATAGVADASTGDPVTAETRFALGSLTKSMMATAFARLADAGRLTFDDVVAVHVPEVRGTRWGEQATLRDLLANCSQVPLRAEWEFTGVDGDPDVVLSRLATVVAAAEPAGEFWSYSNTGWGSLGRALEVVAGASWEDAMRTHVLAPLELSETSFATEPASEPRASGHDETHAPVEPWTPLALRPAGSTILSTARDMLRFARAHLEDTSLAGLRVPHADLAIRAWFDAWCLGLAHVDGLYGWDGLLPGHRSVLRLDPDRGRAVVLLTNDDNGRALYRTLFTELLDVPPLDLEPHAGAAGDLSRYAGVYAWPDRRWNVTATESCLRIERDGNALEALPIDERTFLVDANDPDIPTVTFDSFDADGRPRVLYHMLWGYPRE
jgi:CubicO group peptidase (beta-lactamase class C family)